MQLPRLNFAQLTDTKRTATNRFSSALTFGVALTSGIFTAGVLTSALFGSALISDAQAAEIKITDCDGAPRAIREVQDGALSTVEIRVASDSKSSPTAVPLSLELSASKSSPSANSMLNDSAMTASVLDGRASFSDVEAGAWRICPSAGVAAGSYSLSQVAIITSSEREGTSTAAWLGAAGVGVTGLGFGLFSGSGGSSGNTVPSNTTGQAPAPGSGEPSAQPLLPANSASNNSQNPGENSGHSSVPVPCPAQESCLNDDTPTPLPPISPNS